MLFSSLPFLYAFLPVCLLLYTIAPKRLKNGVLLLSGLVFYAWGEQKLVLLFAAAILFSWAMGIAIQKYRGTRAGKFFLFLSAAVSLGMLFWFKYAGFAVQSLNALPGVAIPSLKIALPIGISFYTFQMLSYTVDVYRGDVNAQKNPVDYGAYISFFPQLIAGPIVRYSDIEKQLNGRIHTLSKTASGVRRFTVGLAKKVLLANALGEVCDAYRAAVQPTVLFCWLYAVAFMLQLYFDFSGYSDMAIGLGRIFGFEFTENFNYPYISGSITEFWRRWHISLGSWFRDYVYIPLGGNRRGTGRQLLNIAVVWVLTGMWHGAAWNFAAWGLLFAVLLTAEKLGLKRWLDKNMLIGHVYVLLAVMFGFVLFNASDFGQAANDMAGMLGLAGLPAFNTESLYCLRSYGVLLLLSVIGATPVPARVCKSIGRENAGRLFASAAEPVLIAAALILSTASLADGSFNPFLYFRF